MIESGFASFVVLSTDTHPDVVSELLDLTPTQVRLKGPGARSGFVYQHHAWSLDSDRADNTDDDQTGTLPLRELLDRCRPAVGRVASLPADCSARIHWSAYSNSLQGGFGLTSELIAQIASLGVDMDTTVYLHEDD